MILRMPKLGMEMTEAILSRWIAQDGAVVSKGEPLYEIETDKVSNEIEAPASGTLKHIGEEGVTYSVGAELAELVEG